MGTLQASCGQTTSWGEMPTRPQEDTVFPVGGVKFIQTEGKGPWLTIITMAYNMGSLMSTPATLALEKAVVQRGEQQKYSLR